MSGFEVAGIVLGAFPIAITAIEKYRETATRLKLFFSIRSEYKKCRDELAFHQLMFTTNLRNLLISLPLDDGEIEKLLAAPGAERWKEESVANLLKAHLNDSYKMYLEYIEHLQRVMENINRELAMDSGTVQGKVTSVEATVSGCLRDVFDKDGRAFQLYRIKFSTRRSVRNGLFSKLQMYNDKLEKLLACSEDMRLFSRRNAVAQTAVEGALCSFWTEADKFFKALASACTCSCRDRHVAKLLLQHRTTKKPEFNVTFISFVSSEWDIYKTKILDVATTEAKIVQPQNMSMHHPNHRQINPKKSALKTENTSTCVQLIQNVIPSITSTSTSFSVTPISVLCVALENVEGSCCGYLTSDDCQYYVYLKSRSKTNNHVYVTLDEMLRESDLPTLTQRYNLALVLASSFLQLLGSPWFPAYLRKTDILFLRDSSNSNSFLLDEPYINHEFGSLNEAHVSLSENVADLLDQLGIILLELCFWKLREENPFRKSWPAGESVKEVASYDLLAARDWQGHIIQEAGFDYADAVGWCLGGNRSADPERWRKEMLPKVIRPLPRRYDDLSKAVPNY